VEETAAITVDDGEPERPAESPEPLPGAATEPPDVRLVGVRKSYWDVVAVDGE